MIIHKIFGSGSDWPSGGRPLAPFPEERGSLGPFPEERGSIGPDFENPGYIPDSSAILFLKMI